MSTCADVALVMFVILKTLLDIVLAVLGTIATSEKQFYIVYCCLVIVTAFFRVMSMLATSLYRKEDPAVTGGVPTLWTALFEQSFAVGMVCVTIVTVLVMGLSVSVEDNYDAKILSGIVLGSNGVECLMTIMAMMYA